ncbi:MAG: restriction endonuclease subunit S, partial [Methylocella sp.]
ASGVKLSETWYKTFRYIDISSVSQGEKRIIPNGETPTAEAPSRARQLVQTGDVLVSTVRPNLNAVAFVPEEMDGATASTGFCVLRPKPNRLDGRYLFHWVRTSSFVVDMTKKATGQSYPAVSDKIVKNSLLPLLPLDEQKRIAAILDQADELRRLRQHAIDQLNELGPAIFQEMFGDPVSAGGPYQAVTLESVAELINGDRSSNYPSGDDLVEDGVLFLSTKNVQNGEIDMSIHHAGKIQVSHTRQTPAA